MAAGQPKTFELMDFDGLAPDGPAVQVPDVSGAILSTFDYGRTGSYGNWTFDVERNSYSFAFNCSKP